MPKSGIAAQVCPCGSGVRPHVALSIQARSLHVSERVVSSLETVYVCSSCTVQLAQRLKSGSSFIADGGRIGGGGTRDRILQISAGSVCAVWEEIADLVPE